MVRDNANQFTFLDNRGAADALAFEHIECIVYGHVRGYRDYWVGHSFTD
jgi:hypothetical protein